MAASVPSLRKRSSLASMSSLANLNQSKNLVPAYTSEDILSKAASISYWPKIQESQTLQKHKTNLNLLDSFNLNILEEEEEAEKLVFFKFPFLVLNPRRRFRLIWDIGIVSLAFLSIFTVLLRLAFETTQLRYRDTEGEWAFFNNPSLMAFEYTIDIIFLINFVLLFRTAYFIRLPNGSHTLITEPRLIVLRYLRSWFLSDLIAFIPWELLVNIAKLCRGSDPFHEKPEAILTLTRLPRILILARLRSTFALTNIEGMDRDVLSIRRAMTIHSGLVRVVKLLVVLVLNIHVWACVIFYVGTLYDSDFHGESWLINTKVRPPSRGSSPRPRDPVSDPGVR
jgi:hypothetical protein